MFRVRDDDTDSPAVNYTTGLATVYCDICDLSKENFPLRVAARFVGGGFVLDSLTFGCSCQAATVYPLRDGADPTSKIINKLAGFDVEPPQEG